LKSKSLLVSELFYSLQGESAYAGYPCVFIRLAGCNLRCTYCDARYAYNEPGQQQTLDEIVNFVAKYSGSLVELTGGEPLIQQNSTLLLEKLCDARRTVLVETNGSIDLSNLPEQIIKIVDLKCPDSGMHEKMILDNYRLLKGQDEIKCVISSRRDYEWAKEVLTREGLFRNHQQDTGKAQITFSPAQPSLDAALLAEWLLADNLPARMQIQLHKILWPGIERGV
jgi:7-carboxy-7-deazaguanine synthase